MDRRRILRSASGRRQEEWFALRALLARRHRRGRESATDAPAAVVIFAPERLDDRGLALLARLPRAVAVLYRAYDPASEPGGEATFHRLVRLCARQRRRLWVAGDRKRFAGLPPVVRGRHLPAWMMRRAGQAACRHPRLRPVSAAVHDMREGAHARRLRVPILLVSPAFRTASHPQARPLGVEGWVRLARSLRRADRARAILALGGMTAGRLGRLGTAADGFAAVGYWRWLTGCEG